MERVGWESVGLLSKLRHPPPLPQGGGCEAAVSVGGGGSERGPTRHTVWVRMTPSLGAHPPRSKCIGVHRGLARVRVCGEWVRGL